MFAIQLSLAWKFLSEICITIRIHKLSSVYRVNLEQKKVKNSIKKEDILERICKETKIINQL